MPDCVKGNTLQHCLILGDSRQPSLLLPLNACTAVLSLSSRSVYIWTERCGFCFDVGFYLIFFLCGFFQSRPRAPQPKCRAWQFTRVGMSSPFSLTRWRASGRKKEKRRGRVKGSRSQNQEEISVWTVFFCLFTSNETRILSFFFSFLEIIDLYTKHKTLEPLSVFIAITYNSTPPHPPSLWSGFIIKAHQTLLLRSQCQPPFVFDAVTLIIVMVITISGHYISRCGDLHYPNQFESLSIW